MNDSTLRFLVGLLVLLLIIVVIVTFFDVDVDGGEVDGVLVPFGLGHRD